MNRKRPVRIGLEEGKKGRRERGKMTCYKLASRRTWRAIHNIRAQIKIRVTKREQERQEAYHLPCSWGALH